MQKTKDEIIEAIIEYFKENDDEFTECIEELDNYNGYLGDDRYYPMEEIDEHFTKPSDALERAWFGKDDDYTAEGSPFNPMAKYFYYNGYGNLVSSNYKDYSCHLDEYFVEELVENRLRVDSIPSEVYELIEELEEVED